MISLGGSRLGFRVWGSVESLLGLRLKLGLFRFL